MGEARRTSRPELHRHRLRPPWPRRLGGTRSYAIEREIEDLAAVINAVGGRASVLGLSSGAALAARGAAGGAPIDQMVLYEPPFLVDNSRTPPADDFLPRLETLLADGRRADAMRQLFVEGMAMPRAIPAVMRLPPVWRRLERVAHTIPYDWKLLGDNHKGQPLRRPDWERAQPCPRSCSQAPRARRSCATPRALSPRCCRTPSTRELAGQSHNPSNKLLAAAVVEALAAAAPPAPAPRSAASAASTHPEGAHRAHASPPSLSVRALDGVINSPQNWHFPYQDRAMTEAITAGLESADAMLPRPPDLRGVGRLLASPVRLPDGRLLQQRDEVRGVTNARPRRLARGGAHLGRRRVGRARHQERTRHGHPHERQWTLLQAGLVDELALMLHPIVVGRGKHLFEDGGAPRGMELVDQATLSTGVFNLTYQPASEAAR